MLTLIRQVLQSIARNAPVDTAHSSAAIHRSTRAARAYGCPLPAHHRPIPRITMDHTAHSSDAYPALHHCIARIGPIHSKHQPELCKRCTDEVSAHDRPYRGYALDHPKYQRANTQQPTVRQSKSQATCDQTTVDPRAAMSSPGTPSTSSALCNHAAQTASHHCVRVELGLGVPTQST